MHFFNRAMYCPKQKVNIHRMKPILTLLLICMAVAAKAEFPLRAKLVDSATGKPVSFATVALYRAGKEDKPVQQVISREDGSFNIQVKDSAQYTLLISHTAYRELRMAASKDFPGSILLAPISGTGNEVVVTGIRKSLVEKVDDKLVYNVESDVSIDGQMATDVLAKTPFVSVDADGNIQLKGQSNFKILLNGKESGIFAKDPKEALKSFPASAIKRIEVTTNPSAKYDAEGVGGIINIITKKKVAGYNASLVAYRNTIGTTNGNASLNIKYGKIGFTGFIGGGVSEFRPAESSQVTQSLVPIAYSKRLVNGVLDRQYKWIYSTTELSYDIDSLNTVSLYANMGHDNEWESQQSRTALISPDAMDTTHSTLNQWNGEKYPWNDVGLDYIRKFKSNSQKEWSVKLNQQFARDNNNGYSNQFSDVGNRYLVNDNQSHNRQVTLQTDFVLPLAKQQKLELGAKGILRRAAADYLSMYRNNPGDKFVYDSANTNNFDYHQDVWAAYFTYQFKLQQWTMKLGSRLEHTTVTGNFATTTRQSLKQDYFNYIPSVYISRKFKEQHDLSFSYSKRLRRPYIWDLNPFVSNTDTLNISYGNPHLRPEVTHSFEIGYSYFKNSNSINVRLSQNICNTQVVRYTIFNNETGVSATTPDNVGENRFTALNGNVTLKFFKLWTINLNMGMQYNSIKNRNDPSQQNHGISGNGNLANTFEITKKLSVITNTGFWQSPIQLQGKYPLNYWYGMGTTYKMLKNQLVLTLRANAFLQEYFRQTSTFSDKNFIQTKETKYRFGNVGLALRWNFGKLTESTSRKRGVNNDDIKK